MRDRSLLRIVIFVVTLGALAALAPVTSATAAGGKPAPVKITLKTDGTGRVISDRAACVRQRDVYTFGYSPGGGILNAGMGTTDQGGHYPAETRRGTTPTRFFALVLGDSRCRVAQSDTVTVPLRAGGPAARRVTLKIDQTSISGRVVSKRKGCVQDQLVALFVRYATNAPYQMAITLETNKRGRYQISDTRRRLGTTQVLAVAIGTKHCRVAQSPTRTVS